MGALNHFSWNDRILSFTNCPIYVLVFYQYRYYAVSFLYVINYIVIKEYKYSLILVR